MKRRYFLQTNYILAVRNLPNDRQNYIIFQELQGLASKPTSLAMAHGPLINDKNKYKNEKRKRAHTCEKLMWATCARKQ
jgi:hypothetical protein